MKAPPRPHLGSRVTQNMEGLRQASECRELLKPLRESGCGKENINPAHGSAVASHRSVLYHQPVQEQGGLWSLASSSPAGSGVRSGLRVGLNPAIKVR